MIGKIADPGVHSQYTNMNLYYLVLNNRKMLFPAGEIVQRIADESMRGFLSIQASGQIGAGIVGERC
jgi:hypothetical protein